MLTWPFTVRPRAVTIGHACALLGIFSGLAPRVCAENPSTIYVYDRQASTFERDSLMASLAGIVARTSPEVFLVSGSTSDTRNPLFWLDQFVSHHPGTDAIWQSSVPWYIDRYQGHFNGYVTYDAATINEATSVAGALDLLMVHESLRSGVVGAALANADLSQVVDVRGRDSSWVYQNYGHLLNRELIFRQQPTFSHQLRDLAVLKRGFVFNNTGAVRDQFLTGQEDHTRVFGWGFNNDEDEFFRSASQHNLMAVPADHLQSAAAPSQWEVDLPSQPFHADVNTPTKPGKHYVAFVMSDGDNVQWLTNDFARDPRWFGSPHRGEFPMNFDLSPSLSDVHPVALQYIYSQAANDAEATHFVTAGGHGINYPSQTPDVSGFMDATAAAMAAVDHQIISVLDTAVDLSALRQMVAHPQVLGLMLKTGPAYAGRDGAIDWHQGKPMVSVKHTLWDGFDTPQDIIAALNTAPASPFNDADSYSIVNVHPWSVSLNGGGQGDPMSNVAHIVANLADRVEVVTLDELFIQLRNNFGDAVGNPWGDNLLPNGDFEVPSVDHPTTRPRDWFFSTAPGSTAWVLDDDSDGEGSHAAAINQPQADWRSPDFATQPGEQLRFSFDFKLRDVPDGNGFRADARFFDQPGASSGFVGETVHFIDAADFAGDVWHSFATGVVVPSGGVFGDVRLNTFFGPFAAGQILIDNVRLTRPAAVRGDFDGDGMLGCGDADGLVAAIAAGSDDAFFDLTGDGLVDQADLSAWLAEAGTRNLPSGNPYLRGDANLDGSVDVADFNLWNGHKFAATATWCGGDFNADGVVDVSDLNLWNEHRFQTADAAVVAEPASQTCVLWAFVVVVLGRAPLPARKAWVRRTNPDGI